MGKCGTYEGWGGVKTYKHSVFLMFNIALSIFLIFEQLKHTISDFSKSKMAMQVFIKVKLVC